MRILSNKISNSYLNKGLKIYNYYILNSFSNFEENVVTTLKFKLMYQKIKKKKLPFLIAIQDKEVIGIAFVNNFRDKSGYKYTHEHSIYINPEFINQGYGTIILKKLIDMCKRNKNIKNLIAVIGGSNNIGSIEIHKKNGFKHIGTLENVGYKKKRWIDSVYMQKKL